MKFFHFYQNKLLLLVPFFFFLTTSYSQSDFEKIIRGSEVILDGLTILKYNKSELNESNSKVIESICVKNKLSEKITLIFTGKDEEDNDVRKEMVIPKDGKECVFEIPKGIYTYEIVLANKEIYKKGEYKFNDKMTITVKSE